jgi:hypothetical protein
LALLCLLPLLGRLRLKTKKKEFAMKVLTENPKIRKYMFTMWDGNEAKVQRMIDNIGYDDLL